MVMEIEANQTREFSEYKEERKRRQRRFRKYLQTLKEHYVRKQEQKKIHLSNQIQQVLQAQERLPRQKPQVQFTNNKLHQDLKLGNLNYTYFAINCEDKPVNRLQFGDVGTKRQQKKVQQFKGINFKQFQKFNFSRSNRVLSLVERKEQNREQKMIWRQKKEGVNFLKRKQRMIKLLQKGEECEQQQELPKKHIQKFIQFQKQRFHIRKTCLKKQEQNKPVRKSQTKKVTNRPFKSQHQLIPSLTTIENQKKALLKNQFQRVAFQSYGLYSQRQRCKKEPTQNKHYQSQLIWSARYNRINQIRDTFSIEDYILNER